MKFFLKKTIFFLLPIIVVFIFPAAMLFFGKEFYSLAEAREAQIKAPKTIVGFSYNALGTPYKKLIVSEKNPEAIALGSSRVMQLRKEFFKEPELFVNAGGAGASIDDLKKFVEDIPEDANIKFLILGLDQEMFRTARPISSAIETEFYYHKNPYSRFFSVLIKNWKQVYSDYFSRKFFVSDVLFQSREKNVGLNAIVNEDGFREDGSYQYGKAMKNNNRLSDLYSSVNEALVSLEGSRGSFRYGEKASPLSYEFLENILQLSEDRGIYVVGFLPPYPNSIFRQIMLMNDEYKKTAQNMPSEIDAIFFRHNFRFYDFSDIRTFGGNDSEFVDISHGTDKLYLRLLIHIAGTNRSVEKYFDLHYLKNILEKTEGDFIGKL